MNLHWTEGNSVRLLENGETFFPRIFNAIQAAEQEILLETFILFNDKVGRRLQEVLIDAARRGVRVELTVDGYGSHNLPADFISAMVSVGICFHVFDPSPQLFGMRTNLFRRLHRKLVVIDGRKAFVGGINFAADHLADFGPDAKQDYAVEVEGPVVDDVYRLLMKAIAMAHYRKLPSSAEQPPVRSIRRPGNTRMCFVTRDNEQHRTDIEECYLHAIRAARQEIFIAQAYFFPSYRLLREIRNAVDRDVHVGLILQGEPDMATAKLASGMLYDYLLHSGVRIFEYCKRPFHGKVAVIDGEWATVGSSNLDPLSLSLNLEANVMIDDADFNRQLRERLEDIIEHHCVEIKPEEKRSRYNLWRVVLSLVAFHILRRYPAWAGWLPAHRPKYAAAPSEHKPVG